MSRHFMAGVLAFGIGSLATSSVFAGGLERGGYNIDLLFDPATVATEATSVYVMPDRKLKDVKNTSASPLTGANSVRDSQNYWNSRVGIKAGTTFGVDCLADYSQPWGAHTKPGSHWLGAVDNIETKVWSDNYALTCSYKWDMGPGEFRIIGGGFYQKVAGFKEAYYPGTTSIGRLELSGEGWGWRAGLGYEIPQYAFKTSLVYNSRVKLNDISGTLDLSSLRAGVYNISGSQAMPDSLEWKIQSGFAPDWLAFGGVKWTNWSLLQTIPFYSTVTGAQLTSLQLGYRDGWTINAGIGHKFDAHWAGAINLAWDRGTSQGYGSQTDTWSTSVAVGYKPTENVEFRLFALLGILTSGKSSTVVLDGNTYGTYSNYSFGNDLVSAVGGNLKVRF